MKIDEGAEPLFSRAHAIALDGLDLEFDQDAMTIKGFVQIDISHDGVETLEELAELFSRAASEMKINIESNGEQASNGPASRNDEVSNAVDKLTGSAFD